MFLEGSQSYTKIFLRHFKGVIRVKVKEVRNKVFTTDKWYCAKVCAKLLLVFNSITNATKQTFSTRLSKLITKLGALYSTQYAVQFK